MIYFPKCKINIGLFVTSKRDDGFHNIESIFYPLKLNDALEMRIAQSGETSFSVSGFGSDKTVFADKNNTVLKAYMMLKKDYPDKIKPLNIYLHKNIPAFAGLGGGSSDGVEALKLIDYICNIGLNEQELYAYSKKLGSDCPFFLQSKAQRVYSKGDMMEDIDLSLKGFYILLVKPFINISTFEAYKNVHISEQHYDLKQLNVEQIYHWKDFIWNDFETKIFMDYPILKQIKQTMYEQGAIYSQMSGSGATIYGIFSSEPNIKNFHFDNQMFIHCEPLDII